MAAGGALGARKSVLFDGFEEQFAKLSCGEISQRHGRWWELWGIGGPGRARGWDFLPVEVPWVAKEICGFCVLVG